MPIASPSAPPVHRAPAKWAVVGVRKILLPPRRPGCLAVGPDGRLGLACCSIVSVLRTPCIGAGIVSHASSGAGMGGGPKTHLEALDPSVAPEAASSSIRNIPVILYPGGVGHEFVCRAAWDKDIVCGLEAPPGPTSAIALGARPTVRDVRYVSWSPLSHGPALFVVTGSGWLHVLRPLSIPLGRWPEKRSAERANGEPNDATSRVAGCSSPTGGSAVGHGGGASMLCHVDETGEGAASCAKEEPIGAPEASSLAGSSDDKTPAAGAACAPAQSDKPKSSQLSACVSGLVAQGAQPAPHIPCAAPPNVDLTQGRSKTNSSKAAFRVRASGKEKLKTGPSQKAPDAGASRVLQAQQNERDSGGGKVKENWLWEPAVFSNAPPCAFPPPGVICVECTTLGFASANCGSESVGEPVVLLAVATMKSLGLWMWPAGAGAEPTLCESLHDEMTCSLAWLSFPSPTDVDGRRFAKYLASGTQGVVKVYRVWCLLRQDGTNEVFTELVWLSECVSPGMVSCLSWWWEVTQGTSMAGKRRYDGEGEPNLLEPQFCLKLGAGALNSTLVFQWTCTADGFPVAVTTNFSSDQWARKLGRVDFVFGNDPSGLAWSNCLTLSAKTSEKHELIVTGVAFLMDGHLLSSSQDGRLVLWREQYESVEAVGKGKGVLLREDVIATMSRARPILGLATLNMKLCVAVSVALPDSDESSLKSHSGLYGKFRGSARLGRILILAPITPDRSSVEGTVKKLILNMFEVVQTGGAAVSWDLDFWLQEQTADVRVATLEAILDALEPLQGYSFEVEQRDTKACAQVFLCLARAVARHGETAIGKSSEVVTVAYEIIPQLSEVLLYFHCCESITRARDLLLSAETSGGTTEATGNPENVGLEHLSHFELASLYSLSCFVLASSNDDDDQVGGPLGAANVFVKTIQANFAADEYQIGCPVCVLEDDAVSDLLRTDVGNVREPIVRCAAGDEFSRCTLTMLPATESILLVCTGCRRTKVCGFLGDVHVEQRSTAGGEERQLFPWLDQRTLCPLCGSSFQKCTNMDESHSTALP